MASDLSSWGQYPYHEQKISDWTYQQNPFTDTKVLPYGKGRSYGDSCLNSEGILKSTQPWNHILSFDPRTGVLRCESGVVFSQIIEACLPQGWFLPVTPGTQFITVGGAIANDVHGKNHHVSGNFSKHVLQFELWRSSGDKFTCSRDKQRDLFRATVGGLGLTGFITWVEIQLKRVKSDLIEQEIVFFENLEQFISLTARYENTAEYVVSWIDNSSWENKMGQQQIHGVFFAGNTSMNGNLKVLRKKSIQIPIKAPHFLLNHYSIKAFNKAYRFLQNEGKKTVNYRSFFYPLDGIGKWNNLYGKKGFLQHQLVVPKKRLDLIAKIFDLLKQNDHFSFLSVLKMFGSLPSEGLLSFPMEGITLAMDFPIRGNIFEVLNKIDGLVVDAGGRIYPAKDARMSRETFLASFIHVQDFSKYIDPQIQSDFWRRVYG